MTAFFASGINTIEDLSKVSIDLLKKANLNEEEATTLKNEATLHISKEKLKEIGIPAVTLRKYQESGFIGPDELLAIHPAYISIKTGVSIETVWKHANHVAEALQREPPEKISKKSLEKGREELVSLKEIDAEKIEKLYLAGVYDKKSLIAGSSEKIARISGIPKDLIKKMQASAKIRP